jgi:hypothetical protein
MPKPTASEAYTRAGHPLPEPLVPITVTRPHEVPYNSRRFCTDRIKGEPESDLGQL